MTLRLDHRRDGIGDGVVAGAPAHIPGEEFADFRTRYGFAQRNELVGGEQHARRAEPTLRGVPFDERLLEIGDLAAGRQPFNRLDGLAGDLRGERQAAAN